MALRRNDDCSECGIALPAGTKAQWDSAVRAVTCIACVDKADGKSEDASAAPPGQRVHAGRPESPAVADTLARMDVGTPGASARKEFERRHAKRERQIEQTWGTGRIGKIAKMLSYDPQSTTAWAQGAKGEELVAKMLHERLGDTAVLLHDRKVPRTRGNIDHLVIAASGVWIIDAKRYRGKVEKRDVGGFFKSDIRLYVGGRDRTKTVAGLRWQLDAVRKALGAEEIPIHCALSFVDAEWPVFFRRPFQLQGVWISWPGRLAELIAADGPVHTDSIGQVGSQLAERLPATPS